MHAPPLKQKRFGLRHRTPEYPIERLFTTRWSPRAYDASHMPLADLRTVLEAARWAPSAYNLQPWRFLYSRRGDDHWDSFLALLDPFNARWAMHASSLVFLISDERMPGHQGSVQRSRTHTFDAGAAWAQLALQATALGYQAHAMAGIHFQEVRQRLSIPDHYRVEIAIALGRQAPPSRLPPDLRAREIPSSRLPLRAIAFPGRFASGERTEPTAPKGTPGKDQP